jgi:hypothetical protein
MPESLFCHVFVKEEHHEQAILCHDPDLLC